eukprot:UN06717
MVVSVQGRRGQRGAHHGPWSCSVGRMTAVASQRPTKSEEGGLGPRGSCMTAHGITIKGTAGATMELGELPRSKNAPENKVVHGGVQLVCMSEPVVWTPTRIEGWRIPLIPAARVATT